MSHRISGRLTVAFAAALAVLVATGAAPPADDPAARTPISQDQRTGADSIGLNRPAEAIETSTAGPVRLSVAERNIWKTVETVVLFGLISLARWASMVTGFVRINVVLILLRQALGSPQVPGNQILTSLALLLTALVMWPIGEKVYHDAVVPYKSKQLEPRRPGTPVRSQSSYSWLSKSKEPIMKSTCMCCTITPSPRAPGGQTPTRLAPTTFPCAWWHQPTCSAS